MYHFRSISLKELESINYKASFPSNQYKWISDWYSVFEKVENNTIGFQKKPLIIAAYEGEDLVAIIPLIKLIRKYCKCIKLEFVEFLGQQWSCIGHDLIIMKDLDSDFIEELLRWIKKKINYHFIFFKYVPKTSILNQKFKMYRYSGAPVIPIADFDSYEDFSLKVYAKKFRKKLSRTIRKIERDGFNLKLSYEEINDTNFEIIKEIAKSKEIDGKNYVYGDKNKENFHLKLYDNFPSHVLFAKFNETPVAYVANIECDDVRIAVDCAFDRDFRSYGVGVQCMDCNIRNSFKIGKKKFSFGVGLDAYKFQFTDRAAPFYMCFDYRYRLKSLLALPYLYYKVVKTNHQVSKQFKEIQEYV